jgi:succinate-semialdehyde dehydrogenase/glutarate-semialdehyde dehydrogenase
MTTSDRERAVLEAVPTQLLIGGTWRASSSGDRMEVEDPATGNVVARVADPPSRTATPR